MSAARDVQTSAERDVQMSAENPVILVFNPRAREYRTELARLGIPVRVAETEEEALALADQAEIVLSWRLSQEFLRKAQRLRWIQNLGAGVDHLVKLRENLPHQVKVTRVVGQFGPPISEYVFAHLLSLTKNLESMRKHQKASEWVPFEPATLSGKVIGVAGLGDIGLEIVRKARAFDMTVWGLSRTETAKTAVDRHFLSTDWTGFVAGLDIVVSVLPLTNDTRNCIDRKVFNAARPGLTLVNVGRGGSIVDPDLLEALDNGQVGTAVLDVFNEEPLPANHPYWTHPNVVVTPHVSGITSVQKTADLFAQNLRRYLKGEPLLAEVDFARQY